MLDSIWEDLKREFRMGNMITRLILLNLGVFVFINLLWVISGVPSGGIEHSIYDQVSDWLSIHSDWWYNLTHPWVIISNMFLHQGFFHILFNMLFLYWFGRIVGDLIGDHRILPIYIMGGLVAGLSFYLSYNLLPYGAGKYATAMGASGSVMAIVVAAGILAPDYVMRLLLIGDVKLKYIVLVLVFVDIIAVGGTDNTGGHFAHLGGAAFGWLFVSQLRAGNDLSAPFNKLFANIAGLFKGQSSGKRSSPRKSKRSGTAARRGNLKAVRGEGSSDSGKPNIDEQTRLDQILDKIKQKGYEQLSDEEKEFLFKASNK